MDPGSLAGRAETAEWQKAHGREGGPGAFWDDLGCASPGGPRARASRVTTALADSFPRTRGAAAGNLGLQTWALASLRCCWGKNENKQGPYPPRCPGCMWHFNGMNPRRASLRILAELHTPKRLPFRSQFIIITFVLSSLVGLANSEMRSFDYHLHALDS